VTARPTLTLVGILGVGLAACGFPPTPGTPGPVPSTEERAAADLVPPGFGTLTQDEFTLRLRSGDLLIKVTPLEEWVIRLAAPDTYERLSGLAREYGARAAGRAFLDQASLFLVSFFSYEPDVPFQPEDLHLLSQGLRYRPVGIEAVTPGWGIQRLGQQQTEMAVYAFEPGIDLERDLTVEYRQFRNATWEERILPVLQAELARVRARARGGDSGFRSATSSPRPDGVRLPEPAVRPSRRPVEPYSSPYFRIFR